MKHKTDKQQAFCLKRVTGKFFPLFFFVATCKKKVLFFPTVVCFCFFFSKCHTLWQHQFDLAKETLVVVSTKKGSFLSWVLKTLFFSASTKVLPRPSFLNPEPERNHCNEAISLWDHHPPMRHSVILNLQHCDHPPPQKTMTWYRYGPLGQHCDCWRIQQLYLTALHVKIATYPNH